MLTLKSLMERSPYDESLVDDLQNLSAEGMKWQPSELDPRFLSISAINSFIGSVSSSRAVMDASHFSSRPSLINPEKKQTVIAGPEYEFGKYIDDIRAEEDYTVLASIPKYPQFGKDNPETSYIVQYEKENHNTGLIEVWLDVIVVKNHKTKHSYFGYSLTPTEALTNFQNNRFIPKDTVLAKTRSLNDDGFYNFGVNLNAVSLTIPGASEDGFIASRSALKKLAFSVVGKRQQYITRKTIPLDLNGADGEYKFMPDIGQKVADGALVFAVRKRDDFLFVTDTNNQDISEVDYTYDHKTYDSVEDSIVIDIDVFKGGNKSVFSGEMTEQLDYYNAQCIHYAESVIRAYHTAIRNHQKAYGKNSRPRENPRLTAAITEHMIRTEAVTSKRKHSKKRKEIDQYYVEVTLMGVQEADRGFKVSDTLGGKGVITAVWEDEDMPVDENGVRADIIFDGNASTVGRTKPGTLNEGYLGACARDCRMRLISHLTEKYGNQYLYKLKKEDYDYVIGYVRGLYQLVNLEMVVFIDSLDELDREEHVREVLEEWIYLFVPPNNGFQGVDVIQAIENSIYKPHYGKLTYKDDLGRIVTTESNARVMRIYYMHLDRTGRDFSGVASAKVNNYLIPIKGGNYDKYSYPHSQTPVTSLSETEMRMTWCYGTPESTAEIVDLALNPTSHSALTRNFLESDKLFDVNFKIDRSVNPYGSNRPLTLAKHVYRGSGVSIVYVDEPTNNI